MIGRVNPKHQRKHGSSMVEMPLALWIIIVGLGFPLMILVMTSVRFTFFWNAVQEAAQRACRCQTFLNSTLAGGLSSVDTATIVATKAANAFSGITLVPPVKVYILSTSTGVGMTTKYPANTALSSAAESQSYVYDIEVELNGQLAPLVPYPVIGMLGDIQGLTAPVPVRVSAQYPCEYPQGLNK